MDIYEFLSRNPYVRIIVPFIIGIVFCCYIHTPYAISLAALMATVPVAIAAYRKRVRYTLGWLCGMVLFLCFFALGNLVYAIHTKPELQISTSQCEYRACVLTTPKKSSKASKVDLQIEAIDMFGTWQEYNAKIAGTIMNDSLAEQLKAGQTIVFSAQISPLDAPKNPFGFDYSQYLQLNGIDGSIFLNSGEWRIADENVKGIKQRALNMRQKLVGLLEDAGLEGNELGLASTLVLGYKNNIDAEIKEAYMNAGAMHVLAVSGMHVGIVCTALEIIMKILGGCRLLRIKRLAIIALLWCYAFITGLSPSVMRATVMFSFVMFGKVAGKNINIYNSLAASAFFLLIYNPSLLFQAGFQLSYVAVIGIVFFQPRIVRLIRIRKKNKLLKYLWELTAVSIAAQIATFPFCLYYFERTPVYFWLSNIIVSPSATIMIFLTLLLLAVSPIAILSKSVGFVTAWVAKSMNRIMMDISNLPFSTIENAYITIPQAVAVGVAIVSATIWLVTKKGNWLLASLSAVLVFFIPVSLNKLDGCNTQAICIYYSPKNPLIQVVDGNNSYWLNKLDISKRINPMVKGGNEFWNAMRFKAIGNDGQDIGKMRVFNGFFCFGDKTGMILNDSTKRFSIKAPMMLDYLIVTGEPKIKVRDMPDRLSFRNVIIDASVKPWIAKDWERKFKKCNTYNVKRQGAYIEVF